MAWHPRVPSPSCPHLQTLQPHESSSRSVPRSNGPCRWWWWSSRSCRCLASTGCHLWLLNTIDCWFHTKKNLVRKIKHLGEHTPHTLLSIPLYFSDSPWSSWIITISWTFPLYSFIQVALVFCAHVQNAVGVNLEGHFDLRLATRSRRDTAKLEPDVGLAISSNSNECNVWISCKLLARMLKLGF